MENSYQELILETATHKFKKYGIHSLSMDDLAKFCGISKKTFYKYFQNKSDLIDTILDKKIKILINNFEELNSVSKNAVIEMYSFFNLIHELAYTLPTTIERDLKKYHLNLYLKYNHMLSGVYKPFIIKNLKRGKQEFMYKDNLNQEIVTKSIIKIIDTIFIEGMRKDRASNKTIEFFENMVIHTIVTMKGYKELNALMER